MRNGTRRYLSSAEGMFLWLGGRAVYIVSRRMSVINPTRAVLSQNAKTNESGHGPSQDG